MTRRYYSLLPIVLLILVFSISSCKKNKFDVDTSKVSLEQNFYRLDQALISYDSTNYKAFNASMLQDYGSFYRIYIQQVLALGHVQDPALAYKLNNYLADKYVVEMYAELNKTYPEIPPSVKQELTSAFKRYKYHFKDAYIPDVVFCATNFNYNIVAADSTLGIGLEFYLGSTHPIYQKMGIKQYQISKASIEFLPFDAMRGWLLSEYQGSIKEDNLISLMIEYGKVLYLMDAFFPEASDALKIGYTDAQEAWASNNEWQIWSTMLEKEVLFSNNGEVIRRYTGPGPFTPGYPQESPSELGFWIGRQIVRAYMEENPSTSLPELMELNNAQELLRKSGYKPQK